MDTIASAPAAQLVLEMRARFDWLTPPANTAEAVMREHVDRLAEAAILRIEPAIRVIVMELLNTDAPSNTRHKPRGEAASA